MPVTTVTTDPESLTMTLVAEVAAPPARVWRAFTQPAQLERFWGPPGWPGTFTAFDFSVGGRADYAMTSPTGEKARGRWEFLSIEPERRYEILDSFVGDDGAVDDALPSTRMTYTFEPTDTGARVTSVSHFSSADALEQLVAMGMVEGSTMAFNQLDRVVADLREYSQGKGTQTEILDDTHVRITRLIAGPRDLVWRAHHEPELMKTWLLGPDGWRMTACEVSTEVGGHYRYAWAPEPGTEGEEFGFDGEVLLSEAPVRSVTTEHMTGTDFPSTTNDLSLYEEDEATLLTLLIEYPDARTRDMVLATGMTDGMEASYARLEAAVLAD